MTDESGKNAQSSEELQDVIEKPAEETQGQETVTLKNVMESYGRRSFGPLLLFFSLLILSPVGWIPLIPDFIGTIILLICGQILLMRDTPWLPKRLLNKEFSREKMTKGIDKAKPWAKRLSRIVHARLTFLTETPFVQLVALICIALCITIYPLGFIPFAVAAPGAGLLFFGIGLTARDGVVILLGMSFVGLTIWLLIELWPKIQAGWNALFG